MHYVHNSAAAPESAPSTNDRIHFTPVFRFKAESGEAIDFTPHESAHFEVQPLDFTQLVEAATSDKPSYPIVITNAGTSSATTGLEKNGPLTVRAVMECDEQVLAYGLVDGGWLPMPWAHKRIVLLDRNILIKLEKIQEQRTALEGGKSREKLVEWLGLDTDMVSPMLCVLEGKNQRPPTEWEIRAELSRAEKAFRRTLPGAKFQRHDINRRRALNRLVLDQSLSRINATQLLVEVVPLIINSAKPDKRLKLEQDILQLVKKHGVRVDSLVVLALLSCVYDASAAISTHRSAKPGRAVLKPERSYTEKKAYNALADLFAIQLLFHMNTHFKNIGHVLYTRDIGMASLWTALQPSSKEVVKGVNGGVRISINFGLGRHLFPALSADEIRSLQCRLKSH